MATRMRSTLLFCLCWFQFLLAQVLLIQLNLRVLRIQYDTAMMRILSRSFCAKASMDPDSFLSDLEEL